MSYHITSNIVQIYIYFTFSPLRESGIFSLSVINDWARLKEPKVLSHFDSLKRVSKLGALLFTSLTGAMYLILFSFIAFKGTCFFCHEADHLADNFALNRFSMCSRLELIF